jgi:capsular exopolysaccharide synthesis family protein
MSAMQSRPNSSTDANGGESVLRPLIRAAKAHRLIAILAILASLGGAIAFLAVRSPSYEATANLLVSPLPQDDVSFLGIELLRESGDPTRTIQTAATIIDTREVAQRTARKLGGGWTAESVLENIAVEPQGESSVLAVTGTDDTAAGAARLSNEFVSSALAVRRHDVMRGINAAIERLEESASQGEGTEQRLNRLREIQQAGDPTLTLSQPAIPPTSPSQLSPVIVVFLALLAGLAIGLGGALLLEQFDRRLRDEEDILTAYELPILARIPLLSRRQLRSSGAKWQVPPRVGESFRTLAVQLELRQSSHRAIMVTSASPGDGKTTCATQLAIALASGGKYVVLVDYDLRDPDMADALGLDPSLAPSSNNSGSGPMSRAVQVPELASLSFLPANSATDELAQLDDLGNQLADLLKEARLLADYVIIDTPPLGEVGDALQIAPHVDDIVLVARAGNTERSALSRTAELFQQSGHKPIGYALLESLPARQGGYYASLGAAQRLAPEQTI